MSASVATILNEALALVGEVAGPNVQTYSEDRMKDEVIRSFNLLFKKYPWHQYRVWFRLELDGTNGIVTTDELEAVLDFEDIISVHPDAQPRQLPILPSNKNPFTVTSGTSARYWTGLAATDDNYAARKLQFYPKTSTGFVNIHTKVYPIPLGETWGDDDIMYLDKDMLVYGAAFMTLAGDDLNPNAADICKNMMEDRFKDIMDAIASQPIPVDGNNDIPTEWTER